MAQPKRNAVLQQLDDVVDEVALQRPRPGAASPRTPTARDASYDKERHERQLRIKTDDVSCENDKIRRRTRALDASTTEAAGRRFVIRNDRIPRSKNGQKHSAAEDCTQHAVNLFQTCSKNTARQKTVRNARSIFRTRGTQGTNRKKSGRESKCVMRFTERADLVRHVEPGLAAAAVLPWTA